MIRDATAEDIIALYGGELPCPARLAVLDYGDGPVAIGGVIWLDDKPFATCMTTDRASAVGMARAASAVMEIVRASGAVARRDPLIPGADRFLRWLGFEPLNEQTYGLRPDRA